MRVLWPPLLLLAGELAALAWLWPTIPQPVTPLVALVSASVLLAGLVPALLRPSAVSALALALATALAGVLLIPFDLASLNWRTSAIGLVAVPPAVLLRLLNTAALPPLLLHFVARFADWRSQPRALTLAYGSSAASVLALLLAPADWPRAVAAMLFVGCALALLGLAAGRLLQASRAAPGELAARQSRLLLGSVALAALPLLARPIGFALGLGLLPYPAVLLAQLGLPLACAYAVLRHDMFGIDAVLRRALAYAALSGALLALYFTVAEVLTALLVRLVPQFRGLAATLSILAAATAFEPLRRRAQRWVDRALYPERLAFQQALAEAGMALAQVVHRSDVSALLEGALPARLGAAWGRIAPADPPGVAWSAALTVGGQALGRYALGPRRSGAPYDADERARLQTLAQQAALALAYADTFDALSTLNRDLEGRVRDRTEQVLAQQRALAVAEERRRLARDLHDSVTQTLFSLSLGARAIRGLLGRNPAAAAEALSDQEAAAHTALAEMRDLLVQLREPETAEEQENISQWLHEHCAELQRHTGVSVTLAVPDVLCLPAAYTHEVVALAREALHNVAKHSSAAAACCTLRVEDGALLLIVADDGRGFEPATAPPHSFGLRGMHERAAALGGTLQVESAPGAGTRIELRAPLVPIDCAE